MSRPADRPPTTGPTTGPTSGPPTRTENIATVKERTTMKAITRSRFGSPDILEFTTTTIPEPAADDGPPTTSC